MGFCVSSLAFGDMLRRSYRLLSGSGCKARRVRGVPVRAEVSAVQGAGAGDQEAHAPVDSDPAPARLLLRRVSGGDEELQVRQRDREVERREDVPGRRLG